MVHTAVIKMRRGIIQPNYSFAASIAIGAISGLAAGLVMAPFLMLTGLIAGMPANTMPIAIGLAFVTSMDNAAMVGFGMHLITSILIGIIFGVVIAKVNKLRITGFTKGTIEGLITGMIAFVVLFIPISRAMIPPRIY